MNSHPFSFKVKHKYTIKELKKGTRFLVVQMLESSKRATSKTVRLAKGFSEPLMIRSRDNSGGYTEGEKGKILSQGVKKNRKRRIISCAETLLSGSCYFERFRILEF